MVEIKLPLFILYWYVWMLAAVFVLYADSHVIGIDFGTEYIKVAGPRGTQNLDIVLNEYSQRKTSNYIAYRNGDWHIGDHAESVAARFPFSYVCGINQLLGLHVGSTISTTEERFTSLQYTYRLANSERSTALVELGDRVSYNSNSNYSKGKIKTNESVANYHARNSLYSAEELNAMMLNYLSKIALNDGVLAPSSLVVTIPFSTPVRTRRAIVDAAEMAGLKITALLPYTMAAAFYYGVRHRGFESETVNVIIFDIGAAHVEAGLYQFTPPTRLSTFSSRSLLKNKQEKHSLNSFFGTLTALAVLEDNTVGGRALDLCVANMIEWAAQTSQLIEPILNNSNIRKQRLTNAEYEKHEEEYSSSSSSSSNVNTTSLVTTLKAHFSLLRAARKAREILSANSHTFYVVEGMIKGKDFHGKLTRTEYETKCKHIFDQFTMIAKEIYEIAERKQVQVTAFEMMGGVSRTPRIVQDVSAIIGKPVDRTLNTDEAAALGAAYVAVRDSPFYNVKSFATNNITHDNSFFYSATFLPEGNDTMTTIARKRLFQKKDLSGKKSTTLTFTFEHDFNISIYSSNVQDSNIQWSNETSHDKTYSINHTNATMNTEVVLHNTKNMNSLVAIIQVTQVAEALTRLHYYDLEDNRFNKTYMVRLHLKMNDAGLIELTSVSVVMHYNVNVSYDRKIKEQSNDSKFAQLEKNESINVNDNMRGHEMNNSDEIEENENNSGFSVNASSFIDNDRDTTGKIEEEVELQRQNKENESTQENNSTLPNTLKGGDNSDVNNTHLENFTTKNETVVKTIAKSRSARVYAYVTWLSPHSMSEEEMRHSKRKLEKIEAEEHSKREKALARNNLESYIFWMKSDAVLENEESKKLAPSNLLEHVSERIEEIQYWLEIGEGSEESCSLSKLEEKLSELTTLSKELLKYIEKDLESANNTEYNAHDTELDPVVEESRVNSTLKFNTEQQSAENITTLRNGSSTTTMLEDEVSSDL